MTPFELAYALVVALDALLTGGWFARDTDGAALTTLDQVVAAVEAGRWPCPR